MQTLSATYFFNALLAETSVARRDDQEPALLLTVSGGELVLPLAYESLLGRHCYRFPLYFRSASGRRPLSFLDAVDLVLATPGLVGELTPAMGERFCERVAQSHQAIGHALSARSDFLTETARCLPGFMAAEQRLPGGHSMHPAGKSCEPLSPAEQVRWLPEYGQGFVLHWLAVPQAMLQGEGEIVTGLARLYGETVGVALPAGRVPYPLHPLQARELLASGVLQGAIMKGDIIDLGEQGRPWLATASTRTLWHPDASRMVKVSLPVRLTNSMRLIYPHEAARGALVSRMLASEAGEELRCRFPDFCLLEEACWAGLGDDKGETIPLSVITLRDNPFAADAPYLMLAALTQPPIVDGPSLLDLAVTELAKAEGCGRREAARRWLHGFLDKVMTPLLVARSDYGLALLAHQQNLLVQLEQGLPVGMAFRDCQGVAITDLALSRFASVMAINSGYYLPAEEINPYLAYYLIGNTLFSVLAALGAADLLAEVDGLTLCQQHLHRLRTATPLDSTFLDYVLASDTLRFKGNFFCYLAALNETTLADPALIYRSIANPLQKTYRRHWFKPLPGGGEICIREEEGGFTLLADDQHPLIACQLAEGELTARIHGPVTALLWQSCLEHALCHAGLTELRLPLAHWPQGAYPLPAWVYRRGKQLRLTLPDLLAYGALWHWTPQPEAEQPWQPAANGIRHPCRPATPHGIVYARYLYPLGRQIRFRVVEPERDLPLFHRWHNRPDVACRWELAGTIDSHQAYLARALADPHQYPLIGEIDGVPFGYFEVYWCSEDRLGPYYQVEPWDRGFHILVGNQHYRGGLWFGNWMRALNHFLYLDEPRTTRLLGEPSASNTSLIALCGRLGLHKQGEFDFPHKRAALLMGLRHHFFQHVHR